MSDNFTQWTEVHPYSHGDREGHPAWGTRIVWYLRGPNGVVQFVIRFGSDGAPKAWDVGYHCPTEIDHATAMDTCDLFDGAPCWYDGTSLLADDVWTKVLDGGGHDAIWSELRECYAQWLGAEVPS